MAKKIKSGLKSIGRAVEKVAKSKLGKVLLAAATIYVGGAALGAWKAAGPLAKVNGILRAGGAAKAGTAASTVSNAAGAGAQLASSGATLATAPTAASTLASGALSSPVVEAGVSAGKGIISKVMEGAAAWATKNPIPAAMALNAAGSMASPDEIDILREQQDLREQQGERQRAIADENLQVGGINTGGSGPRTPLQWKSTQQPIFKGGIINTNRGPV